MGDGIGVGVASAAGAPCPVIYFIVIVELGADAVDRTEAAVVGNILASCRRAGRGAGRGRYGGRRVQITALFPAVDLLAFQLDILLFSVSCSNNAEHCCVGIVGSRVGIQIKARTRSSTRSPIRSSRSKLRSCSPIPFTVNP